MKKTIALLLILTMLLPLASCAVGLNPHFPPPTNADPEETTTAPTTDKVPDESPTAPPSEPNEEEAPSEEITKKKHFQITRIRPNILRYEIYDLNGNVVLSKETPRPVNITMLTDDIVEICTETPSRTTVRMFYDVQNNRFSQEYSNLMHYTEEIAIYREAKAGGTAIVAKPLFGDAVYTEHLIEDLANKLNPIRLFEYVNGKIYLEYDTSGDGRSRVLIPVLAPNDNCFVDYASIVSLAKEMNVATQYYDDHADYLALFGITDAQQGEWFYDLLSSMLDFDCAHGSGLRYDVKDLNGDGLFELILLGSEHNKYDIIAIFSTVDGKPFLLDHYWNRKKAYLDHNGLIYICGSNGADSSSRRICRIAEGGASLEVIAEFGLDGHEWIDGVAVQKYYKLENGEKLSISEEAYREIVAQYSYPSSDLTQRCARLELHVDDEAARKAFAKQAFLDVLNERAKVYDTATGESLYLKDCKSPTTQTRLEEYAYHLYSYTDLDGDRVEELVINCGDTMILRYFEGRVYLYSFTFREMNRLYVNGSYRWNRDDKSFTYGESQLTFDGLTLQIRALWKIVNDGKPNAEYYIGNEQVTQEKFSYWIKLHQTTTEIEYSPLELPWEPKITLEEAWEIANTYWSNADGKETGACGTRITYRVMLQADPFADIGNYHVVLLGEYHYSHSVEDSTDVYHVEINRHLLVDMMTGECKPCTEFGNDRK